MDLRAWDGLLRHARAWLCLSAARPLRIRRAAGRPRGPGLSGGPGPGAAAHGESETPAAGPAVGDVRRVLPRSQDQVERDGDGEFGGDDGGHTPRS